MLRLISLIYVCIQDRDKDLWIEAGELRSGGRSTRSGQAGSGGDGGDAMVNGSRNGISGAISRITTLSDIDNINRNVLNITSSTSKLNYNQFFYFYKISNDAFVHKLLFIHATFVITCQILFGNYQNKHTIHV